MKAASAVLVQSQRQPGVLGLALPLVVIAAGSAGVTAAITVVLDVIALTLPLAGAVFVGLWFLCLRATRANPFFDRDLLLATRFWAGKGEARVLIAGGRISRGQA